MKANVIFFQKGRPTEGVWIFDARSNVPGITKQDQPRTPQHFTGFEAIVDDLRDIVELHEKEEGAGSGEGRR